MREYDFVLNLAEIKAKKNTRYDTQSHCHKSNPFDEKK